MSLDVKHFSLPTNLVSSITSFFVRLTCVAGVWKSYLRKKELGARGKRELSLLLRVSVACHVRLSHPHYFQVSAMQATVYFISLKSNCKLKAVWKVLSYDSKMVQG